MMKNPEVVELMTRLWILLFLIMFPTAKSEDQTGMPETGLLCISDCQTCPVICAPPPSVTSKPPALPPPEPSPQPPVHHNSPPQPQPYYFGSPPPFLLPVPLPPPPPPPPPPTTRPPPPAYVSGNKSPPPPPRIIYVPGNQSPNNGVGAKNYTYPYYYFYVSKATSVDLHQGSLLYVLLLFILGSAFFR